MQGDGNFVQYNGSNQPLWHTSTGGNYGAYLAVQNDGNLVVYNSMGAPLWSIGADIPTTDPKYAGDVVGRDLDVKGFGWLGHLGIWDGTRVVEAGPDNGNGNAIHLTSLNDFKKTSPYWGTASANIPNYTVLACFEARCTNYSVQPWGQVQKTTSRLAIAKRAYQSYLIGADYTVFPDYTPTDPGDYFHPAKRGVYRCDTFVLDTLDITINNLNFLFDVPINLTWRSKLMSLFYPGTPITPTILFNKLKTFN